MVKKKSMENWKIIKNRHSEDDKFDTSKLGNVKDLRGNLYFEIITLKLINGERHIENKS